MKNIRVEVREQIEVLKKIREENGYTRKAFADYYGIPIRTVEDWEAGKRKMPEYLLRLIVYRNSIETLYSNYVKKDEHVVSKKVDIITDADGKKIVIINDVRFKGKTKDEWLEIEEYLKEYIGDFYEIAETAEKVYIGKDFPDEFAHGKDKVILKRQNLKAKANASQVVGELIQIATNKSCAPDFNAKHKNKAKYGWYRYDTRLALPVYNDDSVLVRYNIYRLRMLVRHDNDGKIYLYDFLRTKKETSSPLQ